MVELLVIMQRTQVTCKHIRDCGPQLSLSPVLGHLILSFGLCWPLACMCYTYRQDEFTYV